MNTPELPLLTTRTSSHFNRDAQEASGIAEAIQHQREEKEGLTHQIDLIMQSERLRESRQEKAIRLRDLESKLHSFRIANVTRIVDKSTSNIEPRKAKELAQNLRDGKAPYKGEEFWNPIRFTRGFKQRKTNLISILENFAEVGEAIERIQEARQSIDASIDQNKSQNVKWLSSQVNEIDQVVSKADIELHRKMKYVSTAELKKLDAHHRSLLEHVAHDLNITIADPDMRDR